MATPGNDLRDYWYALEPVWNFVEVSETGPIYLSSLKSIPSELGLLHAAHFVRSEICNGGFYQLFYNTSGVLAPEGVEGFAAVGLPRTSTTIRRAIEILGSPYPRDRPERQLRLGKLRRNAFDALDEKFYGLVNSEAGGFQGAADLYAAKIARQG